MAKLAKYGIGEGAKLEELRKELRRAGKAANQRMRRLEQAAQTGKISGTGYAYEGAMQYLNKSARARFKERPGKLDVQELRTELAHIHKFLAAETSTKTGIARVNRHRYEAYVERGYKGTQDEFETAVESVFTKAIESGYSSDTAYELLTRGLSTDDIVTELNHWTEEQQKAKPKGLKTIEFLERMQKKGG